MAARKQRVYVRGSYLPFEEDETHEFKGHREIAPEDTPPWAFRHPHEHQTRQAISRNLNAFLNTGSGGVVYCGVDDRGRVLGLHLTRYQKDHVLVSVRSLLMRYRPAVPASRYRVTFVPVVSEADVEETPPVEFAYDARRRMKQHLVATSNYCWCDADARARSVSGIIPLSYVVEIAILPWADRDKALHPYYLTESGKCYVRRQASIVPLTAADCIRITRHEAAALSRRQSEQVALASQRDVAAALARLKSRQLWGSVGETVCCCAVKSDSACILVNTVVPSAQLPGRDGERGQGAAERGENVAAAAVADVETPDATPALASSSDAESIDKRSSGDLSQRPSTSSTDGELAHLSSTDAIASVTPAEPLHNTRKLAHSSSSDSGVSLNSSDTGVRMKTCPFSSKRASSSSDCESTSLSDGVTTSTASDDTACAETAAHQTRNFASGIQAVSELLQEVLDSAIPPAQQSPADGAHLVAMGVEPGPDAARSAEGASSEAVTGGVESDAFHPAPAEEKKATGLDLDPGESGSDLARVSQIGSDRALVDLSTSGAELALSGAELVGAGEATPDNSAADLGVSEANLGVSEANLGVSESDLGMSESDLGVSEADLGDSDAYLGTIQTERHCLSSHSTQATMVTAEVSLVESDLGVSDGDSSSKGTLGGRIRSTPGSGDSDLPLCGTTAAEDSGPDPAFSESDSSLLVPEPVSQTPVAHPGPARIRGRGKVFAHPEKVQEAGRELLKLEVDVSHGHGEVPNILEKVLEFSGRLVDAQLDKGRYELDSDDSDDSWDACFQPSRRLTQSDCGTVG